MDALQSFIGPPTGLNLRNLAWHGFFADDEFPAPYTTLLLSFFEQLLNIAVNFIFTCNDNYIETNKVDKRNDKRDPSNMSNKNCENNYNNKSSSYFRNKDENREGN